MRLVPKSLQEVEKKPTKSGHKPSRLEFAVVLCSILGVFHIASGRLLYLLFGILLCLAAWGLHRRKRWAGYLSVIAAIGIGLGHLNFLVYVDALVAGASDARLPGAILLDFLWFVTSSATVILTGSSWSQLGTPDKKTEEK